MLPAGLARPDVIASQVGRDLAGAVAVESLRLQLALDLFEALALFEVAVQVRHSPLALRGRAGVQHVLDERLAAAPALDVAVGRSDGEERNEVEREPLAHLVERVLALALTCGAVEGPLVQVAGYPTAAPQDDRHVALLVWSVLQHPPPQLSSGSSKGGLIRTSPGIARAAGPAPSDPCRCRSTRRSSIPSCPR